ncbi:MAG TPA: hypothetical protein VFO06_12645, partial [Gemmatimonadales bacterium]|nr:hypothetical protein [Gemmatimonadales bacterium]
FFVLEMPHGQTEALLIGFAVIVAVAGLVLGWRMTLARPIVPARDAVPEQGFWKVLFHKYYIDEFYDAVVVRPVHWLSDTVLWRGLDEKVIDGAGVNGSARLARGLGWIGSRLQTGQVGLYVVLFLVGALWVLRVMTG